MNDLAAAKQKTISPPSKPIYETNAWYVFGGVCFIYLFFNWYLQTAVLTDEVYFNSLSGRITNEKLISLVAGKHKFGFFSYIVVPSILLIKMSLVAFCIYAGLLLTSRTLSFKKVFKIVLFAETAFCASALLKLLLLAFSKEITNLNQLSGFAPLSLFSLFKAHSVPVWLEYPLQTIDVFQVAYFLMLAAGLHYFCREPFKRMLLLVLASYGLGLLCCMIGMGFIVVSLAS